MHCNINLVFFKQKETALFSIEILRCDIFFLVFLFGTNRVKAVTKLTLALHAVQCSSTWVTFWVVEIKVILSEGLQAALVVSKRMMATSPGRHDSICRQKNVNMFILTIWASNVVWFEIIYDSEGLNLTWKLNRIHSTVLSHFQENLQLEDMWLKHQQKHGTINQAESKKMRQKGV